MPRGGRVVAAQLLESILPHVGIAHVKFLRDLASDLFRFFAQTIKMALAGAGNDAIGAQQKHEPAQRGVVVGQTLGIEQLVSLLIRIGNLTVDRDVFFAADRVTRVSIGGSSVA